MGPPLASRRGRFNLFGPVFLHDLVCTARRGRYVLVRFLYASLLAGVLFWVFRVWLGGFDRGTLPADELSVFVEDFFAVFMAVQFGLTALLTPAYTAAAITDEKERRTLEFLLATDLRNREIVLGKLAARVANLLLLIITGLPILSLIQLLGGVDPNLIVACFAVLVVTVFSLAALSVLVSVYARRSRTAVIGAYLAAAAYLFVSGLVYVVVLHLLPNELGLKNVPKMVLIPLAWPVTVERLVNGVSAGNIVVLGYRVYEEMAAGKALSSFLPALVGSYAVAHGLAAVVCGVWASARLRAVALRQLSLAVVARPARHRRQRLPLSRWPLLWREVYASRRTRLRTLGQIIVFVLALTALVTPATLLIDSAAHGVFLKGYAPLISTVVGILAVAVACLTLLAVLVGASGSVSGERDRQTLDSLLATPLEARPILFAKWLGSLLRCRWAWIWATVLWMEALFFGSPNLVDVPLMFLCWLVYATLLAVIGLWFSVSCRTSLRALFASLFAAAGLCVGHWIFWLCYVPFLVMLPEPGHVAGRLARIHLGLTPPAVFAWFVVTPKDLFGFTEDQLTELGVCAGIGLLCWAIAAGVLWRSTVKRFQARTARAAVWPPEVETNGVPNEAEVVALLRQKRRRARRRKWLAIASVACVIAALLFGPYYYLDFIASRELRAAIAEVETTDPRWRFEELEADRTDIPDEQNSALRILKAKRLLLGGAPAPTFFDAIGNVSVEVQFDAQQSRLLRAEVNRADAALAEARAVADLPKGRYVIAWSKDYISTLLPHVQDVREMATLLRLDAILKAQDGDMAGALRSTRAILNTGRSLGDEPTMISLLVRIAITSVSVGTLERVLAQGEASEPSLAGVQALLEQEAGEPLLAVAVRGERALSDGMMRQLENRESSLAKFAGGAVSTNIPALDRMGAAACKYSHAWTLRWLTRALEVSRLPAHVSSPQLDELEVEAKKLPFIARLIAPSVLKVAEAMRRNQAMLRCAFVAVAAERFRRAKGRWPITLDELVTARLLREVPLDPYDGQALRLARRDGKLVIYSVGVNRQDDGGNILPNPYDKGADIGFRLWDVSQRRQPPRNAEVGPPAP